MSRCFFSYLFLSFFSDVAVSDEVKKCSFKSVLIDENVYYDALPLLVSILLLLGPGRI